jgi:DNA invertase Pin-like site-specific DNA recombinase
MILDCNNESWDTGRMARHIPSPTPARAVGYIRVSTDKQADGGVSLEAQTAKVRAMADVQDAQLLEVVTDAGVSAKTLQRPGLARVLTLVRARAVDMVLVAKLDRLTRSVRDLADLLDVFAKHGVALVSVAESLDTGSAAGRLVLNVMASVSQWEREAIGERTRDALRHKKANGERVGTVPFGYQLGPDGVALVANFDEQRVLRLLRDLRQTGYTLQAIADELNHQGLRTRRGSPWKLRTVHHLLRAAA